MKEVKRAAFSVIARENWPQELEADSFTITPRPELFNSAVFSSSNSLSFLSLMMSFDLKTLQVIIIAILAVYK